MDVNDERLQICQIDSEESELVETVSNFVELKRLQLVQRTPPVQLDIGVDELDSGQLKSIAVQWLWDEVAVSQVECFQSAEVRKQDHVFSACVLDLDV